MCCIANLRSGSCVQEEESSVSWDLSQEQLQLWEALPVSGKEACRVSPSTDAESSNACDAPKVPLEDSAGTQYHQAHAFSKALPRYCVETRLSVLCLHMQGSAAALCGAIGFGTTRGPHWSAATAAVWAAAPGCSKCAPSRWGWWHCRIDANVLLHRS